MADVRQILQGSNRIPAPDAHSVAETDPAATIDVTVVLARKDAIPPEELEAHILLSPHERPAADHATLAQRFGASDQAVAAVSSFAATYGLVVKSVDQSRRVMVLSGTVANLQQAFGTTLHDYAADDSEEPAFRGRVGPLLVPSSIAPHVEAVLGLDNRPVAKPRLQPRAAGDGFYPQDLATLYQFPEGDGAGQTVAVIELGGNVGPTDLAAYFRASGLTRSPNVVSRGVSPGVPVPYGQDKNSDGEVMLDVEVIGAMVPAAQIVVYFAENSDQGFYQAVSQAVHDPATTAVSISWGSAEKHWTRQTMDAWDSLGQSAALLNVPIFVAAGDHGCTDEEPTDAGYDGRLHADFPATIADGVVACGGTSLTVRSGKTPSETVWNNGDGWATGGGTSTYFATPAWQKSITIDGKTSLAMRAIPDVAGDADPNTGIKVRVNGADGVSGGTSAVAPQWAALAARLSQSIGKKAGFFLPLLYANGQSGATTDIVKGSNSVFGVNGYSARAGWDACTGLGSPNGKKLLSLLSGATAAPQPPGAGAVTPTHPGNGVPPSGGDSPLVAMLFDSSTAVFLGKFILAVATMYDSDPNNPAPNPSSDVPEGYRVIAWIQMQDFLLTSTGPSFYGIVAQSTADPTRFVLAIRGTSNGIEWWDDANAVVRTPFKISGCGDVGKGFARIYDTLEVVERPTDQAASPAAPRSLGSVGGFARQLSTLLTRHTSLQARVNSVPATATVDVTGHSLGAALATLFVMENAVTDQIRNPLLCTFASPLVGDKIFADAFKRLGTTSWRIVNAPDIVPKLPPEILGFVHVELEQKYDSQGIVKSSVACWHALTTYLSLLDGTMRPDAACIPTSRAAVGADRRSDTTITVPGTDRASTITIKIQVGG